MVGLHREGKDTGGFRHKRRRHSTENVTQAYHLRGL
jgi:hypothetical protein